VDFFGAGFFAGVAAFFFGAGFAAVARDEVSLSLREGVASTRALDTGTGAGLALANPLTMRSLLVMQNGVSLTMVRASSSVTPQYAAASID